MIKLSTVQLAQILQAKLIGDENVQVEEINTDTRKSVSNSLFFALKGEKFDAHQYLDQAVSQGALALVVQQENSSILVPQLVVKDTRIALGELAKWLREKINPRTVAMTGSSGKTTVKEMTASILQHTAADSEAVLFTNGNFNNDIGVPLTLLRLTEKHRFAVIELGANHQNEINYTTKLVQPNAALINNIAPAHLEGFGSLAGVVQAKGEIYRGLTKNGVAIINAEHNHLDIWQKEISNHAIQYFNGKDYSVKNVQGNEQGSTFTLVSPQGEIDISLPYLGEHNVKNALAATALAMNVGATLADVKAGLEQRSQVKGRLFPIQVTPNLLLLDDTYNANKDSLCAAIDVLKSYDAFLILCVADMKELGENSLAIHREVGQYVNLVNLDLVCSYGNESAVISEAVLGKHFTDKTEMVDFLVPLIENQLQQNKKVVVLGKGSRSMKMEDVIYSLKDKIKC
ncbi:TPA: UDP-N-acetylmuramoyl-tripeptide--D-alanyl-D-alanine ligase [Haemophilus influenzae]|jgi:UDP-N-acetylmuramoyl-tripeptide--D-alanyl-D-alanine ligase|uniref:UDP-N-acetylmuramoyl-tripeptide--D-alanyl-D-alanine ligase n=2 Tax=Haemophilus influenzae TaxID=727 RepID=A0A2R3GIH8_HAEIF|nr:MULTISPECIES: UDP-N-acetylmuramoyl-tripeptide--D-alanyl-D-alanine ligase [Haemophilus]AAX88135.1 UDP-N-acetylmuramoyl-tripeptide--D-alanyl-D-alanine ligase [Haemophilus influenzae 86-028NP]ADO96600.1 UDP-N-acetylmuramoyl-tripeptide--D-alanyl-D-alanine ligase [Haemophilus influenzae R2846]AIT68214.1 UDP-N-acetylmuramoyl-tripeptide--D-alanyl-D-alanine ligase [Haemophilus influenzae]AJO90973.1 UDP-N-acetylmuramoyl-tripeptide--D-alanyl-D-alanine ligase [Haemophilus influenzae]AVI96302.1 UDP-N-a